MAIAPDGSWLASGSEDRTVRIWDAATGQPRAVLTGHDGPVRAVAIAPDGSWLASGGEDWTVRIWDVVIGQQRSTPAGHDGAVRALAAAPDGSWLASAGPTVQIRDATTGQQRTLIDSPTGSAVAVAVASDGSWVAMAGSGWKGRICDIATGQQRAELTGRGQRATSKMAWFVKVITGQESFHVPGFVQAIAADGSWLASGSSDRTVRIWDAATGQQRAVLTGHRDWVTTVAIAADGSWLASGSRDHTVRIWDAASWEQRAVLAGHDGPVHAVAITPDGSWLASGGGDRTVRIWDTVTGQALTLVRVETTIYTCACFSRSGLAAGGPAGLYLFDLLTDAILPPTMLTSASTI